jgi:hypothetical protein
MLVKTPTWAVEAVHVGENTNMGCGGIDVGENTNMGCGGGSCW